MINTKEKLLSRIKDSPGQWLLAKTKVSISRVSYVVYQSSNAHGAGQRLIITKALFNEMSTLTYQPVVIHALNINELTRQCEPSPDKSVEGSLV